MKLYSIYLLYVTSSILNYCLVQYWILIYPISANKSWTNKDTWKDSQDGANGKRLGIVGRWKLRGSEEAPRDSRLLLNDVSRLLLLLLLLLNDVSRLLLLLLLLVLEVLEVLMRLLLLLLLNIEFVPLLQLIILLLALKFWLLILVLMFLWDKFVGDDLDISAELKEYLEFTRFIVSLSVLFILIWLLLIFILLLELIMLMLVVAACSHN